MPRIVIIDYGSGNLRSAAKAFERVARDVAVSNNPEDLRNASHIVLPGVGAFADCMAGLIAIPGMIDALNEEVIGNKKHFLGICVGMQLMLEWGNEHGRHKGLGWIKGEVVRIDAPNLKIPHMGWNELQLKTAHPLFTSIETADHAYFVHSYHASCADPADIAATVDYGAPITAAIARGNLMGTQFHPEKSQQTGLRLLENFAKLPA